MIDEPDELGLAQDDVADLLVGLPRVLDEREGDVVEQVHGAEEGPVLEEHADLAADSEDLLLPDADDRVTVDVDLSRLRAVGVR